MTIPWMMNCPHSDDGWCLTCVCQLGEDMARWREAAQQVVDLFDPLPSEVSPALLVAVALGAKAANKDLRQRLEQLNRGVE